MTFVFNNDYDDHEQVAPFWPAYRAVFDEFAAADQYPYNDRFKGRIPGIEGPGEDTAIYLLQSTRHLNELAAKIAQYLAAGYEPIDSIPGITKFRGVVMYGYCSGGTGWQEWADARLIPQDWERQAAITGKIKAVLPKGKRTMGTMIAGKVLVLR